MLKFLLLILLCIVSLATNAKGATPCNNVQRFLEHPAVNRFREYLRIDTSKEENLQLAVDFLMKQVKEIDMTYAIYEPAGKPILVATLKGSDPTLPSIMLNSHMDVVPVDADAWSHPPFAADIDENSNIIARGSQDTKEVGMQYLEAIRTLKKNNVTLARTLHVTFMPDEERGSKNGMEVFVTTKEFKDLNVGFALDEGFPSPDNTLLVTYQDRRPWQMKIVVHGVGGHGLAMPDGTTMEKVYKLLQAVMSYRDEQKAIMRTKRQYDYTGYIGMNVNVIQGGLAVNIIPSTMELAIDMRLSPEADPVQIRALIDSWLREAGNNTQLSFIRQVIYSHRTPVDDCNPYWVSMRNTLNDMGINVKPILMAATTDMIYVRNYGIPAFGFATNTNTVNRGHTENEYLNVVTFLKGIKIYAEVIKNLANLPAPNAF